MFESSRLPAAAQQLLLVVALLFCCSGSNCLYQFNPFAKQTPPPRVLSAAPTLPEIITAVNNNSQRLTAIYSTDAKVSSGMSPSLGANLAVQRQRHFRLRGESGLTGPEVDLGSNDELFWFWARLAQPSAVYFCRHEQYRQSPAQQVLPIEPEWLIEALGVPTFDPVGQHSGPFPAGPGRLEVRTVLMRPQGNLSRSVIIDASSAWVLEQHLYDAQGTRVASSRTSNHLIDALSGITLPRRIDIEWPAAQMQLSLTINTMQVNVLGGDPAALFQMPQYPGYPLVDLGQQPVGNMLPPTAQDDHAWRASTRR